jgi:hypothetical protein
VEAAFDPDLDAVLDEFASLSGPPDAAMLRAADGLPDPVGVHESTGSIL